MRLPREFLESIRHTAGFEEEAFIAVHDLGEQVTSIRVNPSKFGGYRESSFFRRNSISHVPWCQWGFYLESRPSFTFDPLFHAGCYYVQEASSMFLEQAMKQSVDLSGRLRVLDLSAAPGGKSTHLHSLLSKDSLLVSNEVIRQRAQVLRDNIIKWGCENVVVSNNDPRDFARLGGFFDVIVVDAPCSGSGLFRRDPEAIHEWSLNNVALCSQRQQRILSDVLPALREGGILVYSTCSYSVEEDESIMDWLVSEKSMENISLKVDVDWGITRTSSPGGSMGYRCWPDKVKGEGFFIACFRKNNAASGGSIGRVKHSSATKQEAMFLEKWMSLEGKKIIRHENTLYCWPSSMAEEMGVVLDNLRVIYSGVKAGEMMRNKLVPDHALAMSLLVDPAIPSLEVEEADAIRYLQRKEMLVEAPAKGWHLVKYEGHSLGWVNVLSNRMNNYYPKELRILKDS